MPKRLKPNLRHVHRPGNPALRLLYKADRLRQLFRERHLIEYLFVHINKAGGKSVEAALDLPFRHATAVQLRELFGPAEYDRRFVFAFVRNPWSKVVSHYNYRRKTGRTGMDQQAPEFNEWVRRAYGQHDPVYYDNPIMFMPQTDWLVDAQGTLMVRFVGKLERFSEDFAHVCEQLDVEVELPHVNKTPHKPHQDHFEDDTRELIGRLFASDIERWGYTFDR